MANLAHILGLLYDRPWVILPHTLGVFIALAERQAVDPQTVALALHYDPAVREAAVYAHQLQIPLEMVARREGTPVDGHRVLTRRGSTAVLAVTGPITRRPVGSMSGPAGASIDAMTLALDKALADPSFSSILLDVDSPGGEVNGTGEFSQMLYDARGTKPIWAYVSDLGASAAYWIASSAERIITAETAALGSIGAVAAVRNPAAYPKTQLEFVSSVSPHKRPDPTTDAGAASLQALVDTYGEIFVEGVARNRGVSRETVLAQYGQGSLLIGRDAVKAGLADTIGSFEGALADLAELTDTATTSHRPRPAASGPTQRALPTAETTSQIPVHTIAAGPPEATRRGFVSDFMSRLRALVDSADAPTGSADQEAQIVTANLTPPQAAEPQPAVNTVTRLGDPAPTPQVIPTATANELARLQAENARLKRLGIEREAVAFVSQQKESMRCMPAEEATLTALFMQAAIDDQTHGPVDLGANQSVLRTTLLANVYATRPTRAELTDQVLGESYSHVMAQRQTPKRDPNAPPDQARKDELLSMTAIGRQILASRKATNGAH